MPTLFRDDKAAVCESAQISVSEMCYSNEVLADFVYIYICILIRIEFFLILVVHLYQQLLVRAVPTQQVAAGGP